MAGRLLGCPHCGDVRFTRLSAPYHAGSEARCAGCGRDVKLADLHNLLFSVIPAARATPAEAVVPAKFPLSHSIPR